MENSSNEEGLDKSGRDADKVVQGSSRAGSKVMTLDQELPILVGANRVARIPFPMTEDDFDLLIGTLNLWKKKLLAPESKPDAKSEASSVTETD